MEMTREWRAWVLALVLAAAGAAPAGASEPQALDLQRHRRMALSELASELRRPGIVVVGEHHTNEAHHRAQLAVIRALAQAGAGVAVGLEMFRRDSQPALDRWISWDIGAREFEAIFADNWGYPWAAYREIFEYARDRRLPMIGLNVPRDITRQVARSGFRSLSEAQRGQLADVTCSVDAEYMRYIRRVYGAHAHGNMNFTFFCEAQMVWDAAMAVHALDHLAAHPEATVVVLTGAAHAQKAAVPRQIRLRSPVPVAVILPEAPGSIDERTVGPEDADFLLLEPK